MKKLNYDRITTTIERQWLAQIVAGTKKIEYRQIKPYWTKRFAKVSVPFELRLLNGMNPPVPEVTVLIHRSQRTAALVNTDSTSKGSWDTSIGTSGGRSRNGDSASRAGSKFPRQQSHRKRLLHVRGVDLQNLEQQVARRGFAPALPGAQPRCRSL
jgi:hypothetical protein